MSEYSVFISAVMVLNTSAKIIVVVKADTFLSSFLAATSNSTTLLSVLSSAHIYKTVLY